LRSNLFAIETVSAFEVELLLRQIRFGIDQRLFGHLELLTSSSSQAQLEFTPLHRHIGFIHGDFLTVIVGIKLSQHLPLLYPLAFFNRQLHDPARHFESHDAFVNFNIAGDLQHGGIVRFRIPPRTEIEKVTTRNGCNNEDENGKSAYHNQYSVYAAVRALMPDQKISKAMSSCLFRLAGRFKLQISKVPSTHC
jgi:hypothetical protein